MIRKGTAADIPAVTQIYSDIHTLEETGRAVIGWSRAVYPTEETARTAAALDDLYVFETEEGVLASARINKEQVDCYAGIPWLYGAPDEAVLVIHTLTVAPSAQGRGIAREFVAFYEELARRTGCTALRLDTNERNAAARRLYASLGYREAGIVPTVFNGIPGVNLVCLEKQVKPAEG